MTAVSLLQDPHDKGGVCAVVQWYRKWMDRHRPGERVEFFLDESSQGSGILRLARRPPIRMGAIQRCAPRLHLPQYYVGRHLLRDKLPPAVDEVHVIGASAMHGYLNSGPAPSIVWMGTTIGDERRNVMPFRAGPRAVLYRATLAPLEAIEKKVLLAADRVMTHSTHTGTLAMEVGVPRTRVAFVPVPIDTETLRPDEGIRKGILFVGRILDPRKAFERCIELQKTSLLAREEGLDVVSPGEAPKEQNWGSLGIRWRGKRRDLGLSYRRAKLLVLSSHQEGLGIVVFEALASGTPVVSFRCGGPDSLIEESGGGFVVDSSKDFRQKVELLLTEESLRKEMGEQGREWVDARMSAKKFMSDGDLFRL